MTRFPHCFLLLLLFTFALSGCTQLSQQVQTVNDSLPWNADAAARRQQDATPVRIAAVWAHDVISIPGKNPVQGFGGRIYFYNHEQKPLQVEGELVVFAFDDTESNLNRIPNRKPDRKFVFRDTELHTHFSESQLGPSYSFWIPWQELGGDQKLVSLVPVFVPTQGQSITGHFSRTTLPGRVIETEDDPQSNPLVNTHPKQDSLTSTTISASAHSGTVFQPTGNVRATTFDLPQNLTRHLTNAPYHVPGRVENQPVQATRPRQAVPMEPAVVTRPTSPAYQTLQSSSGVTAIKVVKPEFPFSPPPIGMQPNRLGSEQQDSP
ncbi:MAG: hypothetical protein VX738_02990 [Planctomycetota bacterium]|nr:hypothetical protein [Planctomycetota bacterium]